jgi:Ca2+-binding RTX toxin-like protein
MAKHVFSGSSNASISVDASGDSWIVTRFGSVHAASNGIYESNAYNNSKIVVNGFVDGESSYGINSNGANAIITVGKTGIVDGNNGVGLFGDNATFSNAGRLAAAANALVVKADFATVENSGVIGAGYGLVYEGNHLNLHNTESGIIDGTYKAVSITSVEGQSSRFTNDGLIQSASVSFSGDAGREVLVNHGTIKGTVFLGDGKDLFDNRGGTLKADVYGDSGNDVYIVDRATTRIFENVGQGDDLVKSTVDYTLKEHFEKLTLLGKGDTDGTGNALNNTIIGNAGDNRLVGKAGSDRLNGGAGDDMLIGGTDADTFIFSKTGGDDRVRGFEDGIDHILLQGVDLSNFAAFKQDHVSTSGDDLVITFGANTLTIEDMKKADLTVSDFVV